MQTTGMSQHTPGTLSEQWLTTENQRLREINRELLAALEAVETLGLYGNDKHNARSADRVADLVTAAIRKAQEG